MITLKIDSKEIVAEEGLTILQIAKENGIHIPTLCHMDGIHDTHSCRICVVEVEGAKGLVLACESKAVNNMVIRTASEEVLKTRRTIISLMLANGEHNCLCCEASGECSLQSIAFDLGVSKPAFNIERTVKEEVDDSSVMITRDNKRCILCKKCVTVCKDIVCNDVLSLGFRGSDTTIICDDDKPMGESSCVQCGQCVQVCPVGALINKKSIGKAQSWQTTKVRTTCPYCGVGCQQYLHMKGDKIVKVTGVEDGFPNKGRLCVKGRYGYDFIYSKERLTSPLIKENGVFREASWDEALDLVASKFKGIIEKYGSDAVGGISCARSINEDSYQMQKLFRAAFKSRNIDHCARVCHGPTVAGLINSFGTGGMTNSIGEFANTQLLFCIGTNMSEAHPIAATFVKNGVNNGAKLIVVDPRKINLADYADEFAQIKVGSDIAFLNGLMNVLITEDLYDKEFVQDHCENFDVLKEKVLEYPPKRASEISGVSEEQIIKIARMLANNKPGMALYTLGITEHTCGTNNVMSVANLQMLLGNIGKENAGVNPLRGQNNVQGACDMGALPNLYPGYQKVTDSASKAKFEKAWDVEGLPDQVGKMIPDMLKELKTKEMRALYVFGENIVGTEPDISHVISCLEAADFVVCNDIFQTETTQYADVVLPAAAWSEDEGTFTNCERRVSMVRKVKDAPGLAKPNWWIFREIARRFGCDWDSNSGQELWDNEISPLSPPFKGLTYKKIEGDGIQWPCTTEEDPGTQILHVDGNFTRGRGQFMALDWTPPAEVPDEEYPFTLSTGRRLYHYHTRTQTGRCEGLNELLPEEYADISDIDAQRMGIDHNEMIIVKSRRGVVKVKARVSERIQPGLVWMAMHYFENNANWLTNTACDTITKTPEYKACAVAIEKIV